MSQYFTKPYKHYVGNIKVKLDLSNYVTITDIKGGTGVVKPDFAILIATLIADVDKIDIDELKTVPIDLSKLSKVEDDVVKKTVYNKLATKVNSVDAIYSNKLKKAEYATKIEDLHMVA